MKISELIKELKKVQAEQGDLEVIGRFTSGGHGYPDSANEARPALVRAAKCSYFGYLPPRHAEGADCEYVVQL